MAEKAGAQRLVTWLAIAAGLYQLYVAAFGASSTIGLRVTHWIFMSALCFLTFPTFKKQSRWSWLLDLALAAVSVAPGIYLLLTGDARLAQVRLPNTLEMVLGIALIVTVLETTRRTSGMGLTALTGIFLAYALYGHLLPGVMGHREYSLGRIVAYMYLTADGVYGTILGVSATFILLFILFGALLNVSGAGQLFIDATLGFTGTRRGGPAKASIIGSALMGMISGSPAANVLTTGQYTIPLMKKTGYRDYEAAAVSAVASVGGMIMPPIMGAAAFIMADYLGLPYSRIALGAFIPACLYYFSLYCVVHLRAHRRNMAVLSRESLPDAWSSFKSRWYLLIPVAILVAGLIAGWSTTKSAFWAIVLLVALMAVSPDRKTLLPRLIAGVEDGVRSAVPVATATAVAGLLVGVVNLTGIGVKFSAWMVSLSGANSLIGLAATAVASLILGLGLPASATYILLATLSAPALVKLGFTPLAAHMFVFYFGVIGDITPPVALSVYAASGIAKSDPDRSGWHAFAMGFVAYLVPFIFAYRPALLMEGSLAEILWVTLLSGLGVFFFSVGMERYLNRPLPWWSAGLAMISGLLLMMPSGAADLAGGIVLAVFLLLHFLLRNRAAASEALAEQSSH